VPACIKDSANRNAVFEVAAELCLNVERQGSRIRQAQCSRMSFRGANGLSCEMAKGTMTPAANSSRAWITHGDK
jgi:hypothetical protein